MTDWQIEVIPFLENQDYSQVIKIYEEIIENDPEEVNNYWYLGLAYLLEGNEEEAQTTWFFVLMEVEEENRDKLTQDLLQILEIEAKRQLENENYAKSWLVRRHIKQIAPELVDNLLYLLQLEFLLNTFKIEYLTEWGVIDLIEKSAKNSLNYPLLESVLIRILDIPTFESVAFAKSALSYREGNQDMINLIFDQSRYLGNQQNFKTYAADLIKLCLEYQDDNLFMLKELFWFYALTEKFEELKEVGTLFYQKSKNLIQKAFGSYQLLYVSMLNADWLEAIPVAQNHKILLNQLTQENPEFIEQFIRDSFILIGQPLLYLEDKPKENRLTINKIANLFQQNCRNNHSCPVHFLSPQQKVTPRKLKIAYIGHTLKRHSVGWLSRWLIHYHNHEEFEIFLYFLNQNLEDDEIHQKWFREKADFAMNLPLDVSHIITQIEKDEIDILIDLDSFTFNITAFVMALKPAPIQIGWLGMDTTGLPAIDYFIADPSVLPSDAQEYYQEKIWRLPHTYLAVDGFERDVPILRKEDLDIPENAIIYFNIQNALKRHPNTIHLQMKILKAVPNSYLLIKGTGKQDVVESLFRSVAQEEGVDTSRLIFLEKSPTEKIHRANLAIADVVLDTYPYNGATTTLETLWMEIPLVTRVGEQFAARNSYTFMINAGITEGIAFSDEEYVEWGIKLGNDENLRKEISWKLRQSKKTSPLWNGKQFAKEMEKAYQQMWQIYLNQTQQKN